MASEQAEGAFPTMDSVDIKPPSYESTSTFKAGVKTFIWCLRAIEIVETTPGGATSISDKLIPVAEAETWMNSPFDITTETIGPCASLRLLVAFTPFSADAIPQSDPADKYEQFELSEKFLRSCGIFVPTPNIGHWLEGDIFLANRRFPFYHNGYEADAHSCSRFVMGVDRQRLFVTHNSETAATRAIYIFPEDINNPSWVEFLIKSLKHSAHYLHHPLGVPALVAELRFASRRSPIQTTITGEVYRITNEIQMGHYEKVPRDAAADAKWLPRHGEIAESLHALAYNIVSDTVRQNWLKQYVDYLVRYNKRYTEIMNEAKWQGKQRRYLVQHQSTQVAYLLECLQDEILETQSIIDHCRDVTNLILPRVIAMGAAYDAQTPEQRSPTGGGPTPASTGDTTTATTSSPPSSSASSSTPSWSSTWVSLRWHGNH